MADPQVLPSGAIRARERRPLPAGTTLVSELACLLRLTRVGLHLARGVAIAGVLFPFMTPTRQRDEIGRWSAQLLKILAVRLHVQDAWQEGRGGPLLIAMNHVSWLDIYALNAALPSRFVAKSEVRRWPVIGWLCARAGTLFIERAWRGDAVRVNRLVAAGLRNDERFVVFPEGTTTAGSAVLAFHGALLQPAIDTGAPLQPAAIRYVRRDGSSCTEIAYDGSKSLWSTLRAVAMRPGIEAHLVFLPSMPAAGRHRHALACEAREAILRTLFPPTRCSRSA